MNVSNRFTGESERRIPNSFVPRKIPTVYLQSKVKRGAGKGRYRIAKAQMSYAVSYGKLKFCGRWANTMDYSDIHQLRQEVLARKQGTAHKVK